MILRPPAPNFKAYIFFFLLIWSCQLALSQPKGTDSLIQLLETERVPQKRIDLLNSIAYNHFDYNDSIGRYYAQRALDEAERGDYPKGKKYALMMVGLGNFGMGNFREGLRYFRLAKQVSSQGDFEMDSYNYMLMGKVFFELADYDSSLHFYRMALDTLSEKSSNNSVANVHRSISQVLLAQWKNAEALEHLETAERLATTSSVRNEYILTEIWTLKGVYYENVLDYEKSEEHYLKLCEIARKDGDMYHLIKCELRQADLARTQGDFAKALRHCFEAIQLNESYSYPPQVAEIYFTIGEVYTGLSQHELATKFLFQALAITEKIGLRNLTAKIQSALAWVNHERNNEAQALDYIEQSLAIRKEIKDKRGLGNSYNVRGLIFLKQGKYAEAEREMQTAMEVWNSIDHRAGVAAVHFNLGLVYVANHQLERALQSQLKTIEIEESIGSKKSLSISYNGLADLLIRMGRLNEAEKYLGKAAGLAQQTKSLSERRHNNLLYSDLYKARGDYRKAFEFLNRYNNLSDSVFSETNTLRLAEMETLYQVEQKDEHIKLLSRESELQESKIELQNAELARQRAIIIFASLGFALISLLALTTFRYNRNIRKAHRNIVEQKEEIQAQAEELVEGNELLVRLNKEITEKNEEIQAQTEELQEANQTINQINRGLEEKIAVRTNDLKQAYKELDTFFYRSSHDFRRPLTTFLGLAEVAKVTVKDPSALELFEKVRETASNLDKMLVKLQSISDVGAQQLIYKEVFLRELFEESVDNFRDELQQKGMRAEMSVNLDESFHSYPALVKIILENLIENAISFCGVEAPTIWLEASCVGDNVLISVKDNGQGISPEVQGRIFEMYYRGNERSRGNGLGLYIVKKAVEKLEGTIDFETSLYKGTTFRIQLPNQMT